LPIEKDQVAQERRSLVLSAMAELKEQDRGLSHAENVIAELASQEAAEALETRIKKLTSLLSSLTTEHLYSSLERFYLEMTTGTSDNLKEIIDHDESESALIKSDLESLFPEIEILAQVATDQQYQAPIQHELDKDRGNSNLNLQEILSLVSSHYLR
jgi:hypothetical protein